MSTTMLKQPHGVNSMILLQLLGMMGFSMIYSLVVLYATQALHIGQHHAYAISASFNALAFAMSVPGGYIAQRYTGYYWGSFIAAILCALGLCILMVPSTVTLYAGVGIFTMGSAMLVACLYVLLGRLYTEKYGQVEREHGFMWAYIGMNIGAFITSTSSGTISHILGYHIAFAIGMVANLAILPVLLRKIAYFYQDSEHMFPLQTRLVGIFWTIVATAATVGLMMVAEWTNALMLILGVAAAIWVIMIARQYNDHTRSRIMAFLLLTVISVVFWALYSLTPSAITIFTQYNVDRVMAGIKIPAADFTGLNPFFIVAMGPIINHLFKKLSQRGIHISLATKFALGLGLMAAGYGILAIGIAFHHTNGQVSSQWLVYSYFLQTVGELFVGPVGYAMVGSLVPAEKEGIMMGIWQLATGVAGALSEYLSDFTSTPSGTHDLALSDTAFMHAFTVFSLITLGFTLIAILCHPYLKRRCH